jgi:TRAP-type C4-dicarboxylate transport system permease small subunit
MKTALRFGVSVAGLCVLGLAIMITTDVILRWWTGVPITGVFEIAEILLLLMVFLSFPYLHFQSQEMSVDLLRSNVTGKIAKTFSFFDVVLSSAFFALLTWDAASDFLVAVERGYTGRGLIKVPTAIPLGIIVFGAFLTVLALLTRTYKPPSSVVESQEAASRLIGESDGR